jgi:hypothetical protein
LPPMPRRMPPLPQAPPPDVCFLRIAHHGLDPA